LNFSYDGYFFQILEENFSYKERLKKTKTLPCTIEERKLLLNEGRASCASVSDGPRRKRPAVGPSAGSELDVDDMAPRGGGGGIADTTTFIFFLRDKTIK
jgi:hypothetical protein